MRSHEFIEGYIPEPPSELDIEEKGKLLNILRDAPSFPKIEKYLISVEDRINLIDELSKKFIIDDLIEMHLEVSQIYSADISICVRMRKLVQKLNNLNKGEKK
jgi:hypothetical protein